MDNLQKRFGRLVAAHRKKATLTQERLAERAGISIDSVRKIEAGTAGASFSMIEKLARTLNVDPAEFFTAAIMKGTVNRGKFHDLAAKLAELSDDDVQWASELLAVALRRDRR